MYDEQRRRSRWQRRCRTLIGTAGVLAVTTACDGHHRGWEWGARMRPYLVVAQAAQQPESPDLGTIVVLQQRGGWFVRLKAAQGTILLSSDPGDAAAHSESCIPAPRNGALFYFTVMPAQSECELYVDLLGRSSVSGDCSGDVLQTRVLPVTTKRANPPSNANDAASDAASDAAAGGTGGTSTGGAGGSSTGGSSGNGGASGGGAGSGTGGAGGTGGVAPADAGAG